MYAKKIRSVVEKVDGQTAQRVVDILNAHPLVLSTERRYSVDGEYVVLTSQKKHLSNDEFERELTLMYGILLALNVVMVEGEGE